MAATAALAFALLLGAAMGACSAALALRHKRFATSSALFCACFARSTSDLHTSSICSAVCAASTARRAFLLSRKEGAEGQEKKNKK